MTMSTNLGWPSEPDPEPEQRRLGWLARMLGVSRETDAAPQTVQPQVRVTTDTEPSEPSELPEPPQSPGSFSPESDSPESDSAERVDVVGRSEPGVDREDAEAADGSRAMTPDQEAGPTTAAVEDPVPGVAARSPHEAFPTPGSAGPVVDAEVGARIDGASAADDHSADDHSAGEEDASGTHTRRVPEGGAAEPDLREPAADVASEEVVAAAATAAATGNHPSTEPVRSPSVGHADVSESSSSPVDKTVDAGPGNSVIEQEISTSRAGDNVVDEALRTVQHDADDADREALVAALPTPGSDTPLAMELAENARRRIQLTGRPFPKPAAPRVLTVANQKGGVGKTTTTVNVAAALAQAGLTVLVIDLDPQGNASTALGIDHHAEVPSIYDVLVDGTPLLDVVQPCTTVENLHCAPATIDLAGAEIELVSLVARESRLQKAIAAAAEQGHAFDYILIDCPPSLGLLTVNAMVAASEVFIPIQCEYYALEGLSQLLKNIDLVKRHLNPALHVSTILLTMYDGRTRLSAQVADEVREHFPEQVLRTTVPRSVRVSEAPSFGETVMTYDPASSGALAYLEAAGELADRGAAGPT